ncbi:hypothetical protein ZWY2020_027683 [Hordeum vulgare]|nr:hypothetical protein ZWY2020_027683 [Hordeum vulgare]
MCAVSQRSGDAVLLQFVSLHTSTALFRGLKMSNTKISLLSQIHDKEMTWNAKVVVSRMWHYRGGSDNCPIVHTDVVVPDQEGTHMYGQIPSGPTENLKDILEEGKPGIEEDYPYCTYNLISFSDIPVPGPNTHRLLDVIGRITSVTHILVVHSQYKAEPSDTRTIVLEDQAGNEISLVLWGARAREFDAEEVRTASNAGVVIAIFVGTLPKMYRGVKGLSGSSACRWYIDEDLPKMNAFRASLSEGLGPVTAHIPGEQPMVATPVREPLVEMNVKELLALDPFDNLKIITLLMELAELSTTSLAEAMFEKLELPKPIYHLEQQKKACATASDRLLEKIEEIKQRNKTIKQITREASDYVEEVCDASNKIHSLAAVALDPVASISVCALKKAILEIHGAVAALQSTTAIACPTLQERGIYSDDNVSDPVYNSPSDEDSNEGYHQDMDDDYAHYMRSP